ncbi:MAG TPA: DUF4190 domain-containing protein, partial [Streptosporangiaceae bacterium]|nr:DUF4190 domain-containing protein [Streptosporangiaceae bacterium]
MQHPARSADLNPFAVASLVFGILGFVALPLVGAVLALGFGWLARRQIAATGDLGLGVARAGSILGGVWFILALILLLVVLNIYRS